MLHVVAKDSSLANRIYYAIVSICEWEMSIAMIERLDELWQTGRLVAAHPVASAHPDDAGLVDWLSRVEHQYRLQLPSTPPPLEFKWALWAIQQFYRASQLMVHRELGEQFIRMGLETEPVGLLGKGTHEPTMLELASIHYSVDLHFRFLPDLERLTKAADPTDPLLQQFGAWADRWPLSGARLHRKSIDQGKLEPILLNRCLRIMYIERALDRGPNASADVEHWNKLNAQYEWKTLDSKRG